MKKVQLLSLMALLGILTACGNQNPNPAAYNYGYGLNGTQSGYYPNGYYPNGGMYNGYNSGWYSQPMQVNGTVFQAQVQVYAGQPVAYQWGAMIKCDRKLIDSYDNKVGGYITNAVYTLNGQQVAAQGGNYVAQAAGTLTITADLNALSGNLRCGWSGDRPFQVLSYWVQRL